MRWTSFKVPRPRPRRQQQQVVYIKQDTSDIEALAAKMAEQMVSKLTEQIATLLGKLPASTNTTTIIHQNGGRGTSGGQDGPEAISIDDKVIPSASSDISGIEKTANLQETQTTRDSSLGAAKDKLARLKKG